MSQKPFGLSRRKLLGGMATIGAAGALGGAGTMAFFSDEETFANNKLVAGELDLKVDWEEHYSDWSADEAAAVGDIVMPESGSTLSAGDYPDEYTGLPDPDDALVAIPTEDLDAFMDATAIEAYPDVAENGGDGNGIQDALSEFDSCEDLADTPEDLDPNGGKALRTANDDTLDENGDPKPLISLHDVKPGDFGELTLSFHICDNPGYVWLQGDLVSESENGLTEPEAKDDQEEAGVVELTDEIQTMLWYDDGDNVYEPGGEGEPVDLMLVFDQSESMNSGPDSGNNDANPNKLASAVDGAKSLMNSVGGPTNLGLVYFSDTDATKVIRDLGSAKVDINQDLDDLDGPDSPTNTAMDDNQPNVDSDGDQSPQIDTNGDGNDDDNLILDTDIENGIRAATDELNGPNGRSGAKKVMVVLSDGNPWQGGGNPRDAAADAKDDDIEIFSIAYGSDANQGLMEDIASDPESGHAFVGDTANIEEIFGEIGQIIGGEECFFTGTLRELLGELSSGTGIPLDGNRDTLFDERNDDPASPDRDEFAPMEPNYIGFAWYLPVDHANEIQSDSVQFDFGFYTEQSRHNDGSGTGTEEPA